VIIELIPRIGGEPIRLNIAQFVVRQDNGTPISVGAESLSRYPTAPAVTDW
jgi:hypothetical protein